MSSVLTVTQEARPCCSIATTSPHSFPLNLQLDSAERLFPLKPYFCSRSRYTNLLRSPMSPRSSWYALDGLPKKSALLLVSILFSCMRPQRRFVFVTALLSRKSPTPAGVGRDRTVSSRPNRDYTRLFKNNRRGCGPPKIQFVDIP